ncbi:MAG: hypothetical protein ABJF01_11680 [bacterium]
MPKPHRFPRPAALLLFLLAGCDRPTVPTARDGIQNAQRTVPDGNGGSTNFQLAMLLQAVNNEGFTPKNHPTDTVVVERNGDALRLVATVVEHVYLPSPGIGARPYARRTVLAWNWAEKRGLVLMSEDPHSDIALPTRQYTDRWEMGSLFEHRGFVLQSEPNGKEAWFGRDGQLEIKNGTTTGPCPFSSKIAGYEAGLRKGELPPDMTCETVRYPVSASTTLERGDPNNRSPLEDLIGHHPSLRLDEQMISGVRFVTKCPTTFRGEVPVGCNVMNFWRDNTQFAPQLGVDLVRMHSRQDYLYWQEVASGSGRLYTAVPMMMAGPVQFTLYGADGRVLLERTARSVENDSTLRQVIMIASLPLRVGYHGRIVAPARRFGLAADPYAMSVLDFVLLPSAPPRP